MKKQPIHQNLNTSFVNVTALVRYLSGLQFVGSIRIELASYDADIVFTGSKMIRAREFDHIAGRISHGEEALKRILVRSREPHGRIHVYKAIDGYAGRDDGSIFVDKKIMSGAREMATNRGGVVVADSNKEVVLDGREVEISLVLAALSEVLHVIEKSLAKGNIDFPAAFRIACNGISPRFPFLQSSRSAIVYKRGEITLDTRADIDLVIAAVFAALRPIFRRLRSEVKYAEIARMCTDGLVELSAARRSEFMRLGLIEHIEVLLDVA